MSAGRIQLPSMIDPEAQYVEFRVYECETCGAVGPVTSVGNADWIKWGDDHQKETGHTRYFQYALKRSRARITTMGATVRPARRPLGHR